MSRLLFVLFGVLLLASCGGGSQRPPSNLNNACSIARERPDYIKAFKSTERKWGIPVHVQMATIYQESRYKHDARTPHKYVLGVIPMGRQKQRLWLQPGPGRHLGAIPARNGETPRQAGPHTGRVGLHGLVHEQKL